MFSEAEADCCSPLRRARPYKVCGGRRRERKGMVASTFQELVEKAKKKFPEAGDDLTLVLLEDKTEIDDEEYFQSLPDNTLFLVVPTSHPPRGRQRTRNCDKYQERRQKQKSRKDSGLREISRLLARTGAVTGKGETIQQASRGKSVQMVDTVTQVDAVTIELEISKAGKCDASGVRDVILTSYGTTPAPTPRHLAAQLINKLEKHKKILEKERKPE